MVESIGRKMDQTPARERLPIMTSNPSEGPLELARGKTPWKVLSVAFSAAILWLLYRKLDRRLMLDVLAHADVTWLMLSVGMIVPITLLTAARFRWVASPRWAPPYADALGLTLISNALNLFLPAKLGDLAKSRFLCTQRGATAGFGVSVVVFERLSDVFSVATWCLIGWFTGAATVSVDAAALLAICLWLLSGGLMFSGGLAGSGLKKAGRYGPFRTSEKLRLLWRGWPELQAALGGRVRWLALYSVGIWFLHLTQIWMFTLAVRANVPFAVGLTLAPVVLLCALVPFTFGGIGPRDAAAIYLFSEYMPPELAASVGLLTISRAVVPSVAAIPLLRRYLRSIFGTSAGPAAG